MPDQLDNGSAEPNESNNLNHRQRIREDWNNLIEDLVREGQENGAFDNLPGKGKPLKLRSNLYESGRDLAHRLLHDNGMQPLWISNRKQILTERDTLRVEMKREWAYHEAAFKRASGREARGRLTISWDDACQRWQKQIHELNRQIRDFNLKRPINHLEIILLQLEDELKRIEAPRWLVTIND